MNTDKRNASNNPLAIEGLFDVVVEEAFKVSPPPVLYHYTKWPALEGILTTQTFWATAHDCTNDPAELVSANDTIVEVAKELRRRTHGMAAAVLKLFVKNYRNSQISKLRTVYIASFSAARDDEGQWLKYSDHGRGVCLGVRTLDEPGYKDPDLPQALIRVDYSEASWRDRLMIDFQQVCSLLEKTTPVRRNLELGLSALYRVGAFASISAKEQAWAVEQEFRLCAFLRDSSKAAHYERRHEGRRYVPLPVRAGGKRIALAEILIGPNQDAAPARTRSKQLLAKCGYVPEEFEYPSITSSAFEF